MVQTWINNVVEFLLMKKRSETVYEEEEEIHLGILYIRNVAGMENADLKAPIKLNKLWQFCEWVQQQTKIFFLPPSSTFFATPLQTLCNLMPQNLVPLRFVKRKFIFIGKFFPAIFLFPNMSTSHESNYTNALHFLYHMRN